MEDLHLDLMKVYGNCLGDWIGEGWLEVIGSFESWG
jgi:hypothetical protein